MSLVEQARARLEETRTRIKLQGSLGSILGQGKVSPIKVVREKGVLSVLEEKFPKVKEIRGGGGQGVLGVLGERFPKVKEMREKGILARLGTAKAEGSQATSPATKEPPILDRQEPARAKARVLL